MNITKNMGIQVYGMDLSAPVRIVLMTAEVLGIDYELVKVDLMAGEHKKPEYLKVYSMAISALLYNICLNVVILSCDSIFLRWSCDHFN